MRKSFALFITIILVTLFAILSISIIETKNISSNIDKLKYLHLQAKIHMQYIKKYIDTHSQNEIESFVLDDNRFNAIIISELDENLTIYNVTVEAKNTNIRINNFFY